MVNTFFAHFGKTRGTCCAECSDLRPRSTPHTINRLKMNVLPFDEFHDSGIKPAHSVLVLEYYLHGSHIEATTQQRPRR